MDALVVIVVLGAAVASVAVYAVVGRVLPGRWRKSDVHADIHSGSAILHLFFAHFQFVCLAKGEGHDSGSSVSTRTIPMVVSRPRIAL